MGVLSDDLKDMGYEPTGEESPVSENGELWTNGYEIVCDDTAIIIDGNHHVDDPEDADDEEERREIIERKNGIYRYRNSNEVKMYGGYISSYDWGDDDEGFHY